MRLLGFDAHALRLAGFSDIDVLTAGYTASELRDASFTAEELREVGLAESTLRVVGFQLEQQVSSAGMVRSGQMTLCVSTTLCCLIHPLVAAADGRTGCLVPVHSRRSMEGLLGVARLPATAAAPCGRFRHRQEITVWPRDGPLN